MSKVNDFMDKFFEKMKKNQAQRIILGLKKKDPDLSAKLDVIDKAARDLENYLTKTYKK